MGQTSQCLARWSRNRNALRRGRKKKTLASGNNDLVGQDEAISTRSPARAVAATYRRPAKASPLVGVFCGNSSSSRSPACHAPRQAGRAQLPLVACWRPKTTPTKQEIVLAPLPSKRREACHGILLAADDLPMRDFASAAIEGRELAVVEWERKENSTRRRTPGGQAGSFFSFTVG